MALRDLPIAIELELKVTFSTAVHFELAVKARVPVFQRLSEVSTAG
jgi:hypothetical protein